MRFLYLAVGFVFTALFHGWAITRAALDAYGRLDAARQMVASDGAIAEAFAWLMRTPAWAPSVLAAAITTAWIAGGWWLFLRRPGPHVRPSAGSGADAAVGRKANASPFPPGPYRPISVVGKRFRNERVDLDGHAYSGCEFINVHLVYKGTTPIQFSNNRHSGLWVSFENDAIGAAISLLAGLEWLKDDIPIEMPPENAVSRPLSSQPEAPSPSIQP